METESMSGYEPFLPDTQSMTGFRLSELRQNNNVDNDVNESTMENHQKSLDDTKSMSFVSTRPRKKYIKTEQTYKSDISFVNFTISDKLSSGIGEETFYDKPSAPVVKEELFSIDDSDVQQNSTDSSKRSSFVLPEESITVSETSSDNDQNSLADFPPGKEKSICSTDNLKSNEQKSIESPPSNEKSLKSEDDLGSNEEEVSITAKFHIKIQLSGISDVIQNKAKVQNDFDSEEILSKSSLKKEDLQRANESSQKETCNNSDLQFPEAKTNSQQQSPERSFETPKRDQNCDGTNSDFDDLEFRNNVDILTKLYGDQWKTPAVKKILISQSTKKKKPKDDAHNKSPHHHSQSTVGDFSNCE